MLRKEFLLGLALAASTLCLSAAAPLVTIKKAGAEKLSVAVDVTASGASGEAYLASLKRNLERSGYFHIAANGGIRVAGSAGASASVSATGRGKTISGAATLPDEKEARQAARKFVDEMVAAFADAKGFCDSRIVFVNRKGKDDAEVYMCYPDGYDIRQLTSDGHAAVGPRWAPNGEDIYYTGFLQKTPLIYRLNVSGARKLLAPFKGLATGAAISPDGRSCALILSYQGNPELYILDFATSRVKRMTETRFGSEASPCWSPDGRRIVYVSDTTRHPQLYIVDVATKQSTRLTTEGVENVNPDWGTDGRITWASKRADGYRISVMDPDKGAASTQFVTTGGTWEHPSWARDNRHIVASRDGALFILDSMPDGDQPVRLFGNVGNWMTPAWSR